VKVSKTTLFFVGGVIIALICALILVFYVPPGRQPPGRATTIKSPYPAGKTIKMGVYAMSRCPYSQQFLDTMTGILGKMGDTIDFSVNYIADWKGGEFTSLHGIKEVEEDIRQLCAIKHYPTDYKYMDYIRCRGKSMNSPWEKCSDEQRFNSDIIRECSEGEEGANLLRQSIKASNEAQAAVSPTIVINGGRYNFGRTEKDVMKALCMRLSFTHPACENVPVPVVFEIIVLSDRRCAGCDTSAIEDKLQGIFQGAQIRKVDYSTKEGKGIYVDSGLRLLPAVLLEKNALEDDGYQMVRGYSTEQGEYLSLNVGAKYDPTA